MTGQVFRSVVVSSPKTGLSLHNFPSFNFSLQKYDSYIIRSAKPGNTDVTKRGTQDSVFVNLIGLKFRGFWTSKFLSEAIRDFSSVFS
jgi:hypothetical protein